MFCWLEGYLRVGFCSVVRGVKTSLLKKIYDGGYGIQKGIIIIVLHKFGNKILKNSIELVTKKLIMINTLQLI